MVDSPTPQPTSQPSVPSPNPASEPTTLANGDLTQDELTRRRELREAQAKAYTAQRMNEAGMGGPPLERIGGGSKPTNDDQGSDASGGDDDAGMSPAENLARDQAQSGLASMMGGGAGGAGQGAGDLADVDKQIQEQTNSVNFYLLQAVTDLISFDVACFGLALPLTLWVYDLLVIPILGYELYNAWTGNDSLIPYFPKLTWQSFLKPGGGGDVSPIPLPEMPLYILVLCTIFFLGLLSVLEIGFFAAVIYAWQNPSEAGAMMSGFLGMPSIPGL